MGCDVGGGIGRGGVAQRSAAATDAEPEAPSGSAIQARLGGRPVAEIGPDEPLWDGVAHAIAQLCHVLVCTAAPRRIALAGGVIARQPHLLQRIEPLLVESLAGYIELPGKGPYVIAPELGDMAGPLGPIALAEALAPA